MQWSKLASYSWPVLAMAGIALSSVASDAQAAANPYFFFQTNDNEDSDDSGWLGVYIENIDQDLAKREDLTSTDGVYVSGVVDGSPAEDAGLKEGDVILKFDGQDVRSVRRLTRMIEDSKPDKKVDIEILRDGNQRVLACEIAADSHDGVWAFDNRDGDGSSHVFVPRAPRAPRGPDAPDSPRTPRAYSFSLGQLSNSYIGVGLYDMSDQLATAMGAADGGALVNQVEKDSPAEKAGLKAGDIIVEIDNKKVYDTDDVRKAIQKMKEGEVASVHALRDKQDKTFQATVESNDTWSGVGLPQRFHVRPDNAGSFNWNYDFNDHMGTMHRDLKESGNEWRDELEEQMRDLKEQLKELREELRDNR